MENMYTSFKTSLVNQYQPHFNIYKRWNFVRYDFWKKVIFLDETSFGPFFQWKAMGWRPEGSRLKSEYMKTTVKFQSGNSFVWGVF